MAEDRESLINSLRVEQIPPEAVVVVPKTHPDSLNLWQQPPFNWARETLSVTQEEEASFNSDEDWYQFLSRLADYLGKGGNRPLVEPGSERFLHQLAYTPPVIDFLAQYGNWWEYWHYGTDTNKAYSQQTGKPIRREMAKGPKQLQVGSFAHWWHFKLESRERSKWNGLIDDLRERGLAIPEDSTALLKFS